MSETKDMPNAAAEERGGRPASQTGVPSNVPFVDWDEFIEQFDWRQGEHITLVGPTGSGKTTLALQLLPERDWQLVLATKPRDSLIDTLRETHHVSRKWPPKPDYRKVVYWPPSETVEHIEEHRELVGEALRDVYAQGGWCIYVDEVRYISQYLKHERLIDLIWQQGRSIGISVVAGTQRPAFVPLSAYSQATHLFLWRDNDEVNLRRLRGLGSVRGNDLRRAVQTAPHHQAVYCNTRTGELLRTMAKEIG